MKKVKKFGVLMLVVVMFTFNLIPFVNLPVKSANAATASNYPAQLTRISIYDGSKNVNISGVSNNSNINAQAANGEQTENWRFDYVSENVFRIVNMGTGRVLSVKNGKVSNGNNSVIEGCTNAKYQYWNVTPVSKDKLGNNLYYKITNYQDSTKALTYNSKTNSITIQNYSNSNSQKFLLNTAGLQGFAGYGKDTSNNVKASNIGGLFGQTVYVGSFKELKNALTDDVPRTVVITKNINYDGNYKKDNQGRKQVSDKIYIGNNKTIIGSYNANTLNNVYLNTYYSGDNIILRNITAKHDAACNSDNYWEFSKGNNLWLDHITFVGHSNVNTSSVGGDIDKFLAIKCDANYSTVSDCSFGKHEYGVLLGYPVDDDATLKKYKGKPCVSMISNYFNGCITRGPGLMRYGYFHTLNNYVTNFNTAYTMHTAATIYSENNYYDGGNGTGSVVNDDASKITNVTNATVNKVGPWYTDKGSIAVNCYNNNNINNISSAKASWRPASNYSYTSMKAQNVPNYCKTNAGAKNSMDSMKYQTFKKTGVPSCNFIV